METIIVVIYRGHKIKCLFANWIQVYSLQIVFVYLQCLHSFFEKYHCLVCKQIQLLEVLESIVNFGLIHYQMKFAKQIYVGMKKNTHLTENIQFYLSPSTTSLNIPSSPRSISKISPGSGNSSKGSCFRNLVGFESSECELNNKKVNKPLKNYSIKLSIKCYHTSRAWENYAPEISRYMMMAHDI